MITTAITYLKVFTESPILDQSADEQRITTSEDGILPSTVFPGGVPPYINADAGRWYPPRVHGWGPHVPAPPESADAKE